MRAALAAQAGGVTVVGLAGALALWQRLSASAPAFSAGLTPAFGVDRLSGVFLLMLGLVAGPVLVFAAGYLGRVVTRIARSPRSPAPSC